jgi:hypothetical protein
MCKKAQAKADRAAIRRKGIRQGAQKNGQRVYDFGPFLAHFGGLIRQIDAGGNLYGAKESPEAERLRETLSAFKIQFTQWIESLSRAKERPPGTVGATWYLKNPAGPIAAG